MARKRHTPEQVVNLLRHVEVAVANGKTTGQACKETTIASRRTIGGGVSMAGCRWTGRSG